LLWIVDIYIRCIKNVTWWHLLKTVKPCFLLSVFFKKLNINTSRSGSRQGSYIVAARCPPRVIPPLLIWFKSILLLPVLCVKRQTATSDSAGSRQHVQRKIYPVGGFAPNDWSSSCCVSTVKIQASCYKSVAKVSTFVTSELVCHSRSHSKNCLSLHWTPKTTWLMDCDHEQFLGACATQWKIGYNYAK